MIRDQARPTGVNFLVTFELILGGVYLLQGGVILLWVSGLFGSAVLGSAGIPFVALLLMLGFLALYAMRAMWKGEGSAWTLGISLSIVGFALSLVNVLMYFFVPENILALAVNASILFTLTRGQVKAHFGKDQLRQIRARTQAT